jgi:Ni,Fe-hydrogenase maturation factor
VVVIDAAEASPVLPAGTWVRLRYPAQAEALGKLRVRDSHTLGLEAVLRLRATVGRESQEVWVYALAGERFGPESPMSPVVESAIERLASRIMIDVRGRPASQARAGPHVTPTSQKTNSQPEGQSHECRESCIVDS